MDSPPPPNPPSPARPDIRFDRGFSARLRKTLAADVSRHVGAGMAIVAVGFAAAALWERNAGYLAFALIPAWIAAAHMLPSLFRKPGLRAAKVLLGAFVAVPVLFPVLPHVHLLANLWDVPEFAAANVAAIAAWGICFALLLRTFPKRLNGCLVATLAWGLLNFMVFGLLDVFGAAETRQGRHFSAHADMALFDASSGIEALRGTNGTIPAAALANGVVAELRRTDDGGRESVLFRLDGSDRASGGVPFDAESGWTAGIGFPDPADLPAPALASVAAETDGDAYCLAVGVFATAAGGRRVEGTGGARLEAYFPGLDVPGAAGGAAKTAILHAKWLNGRQSGREMRFGTDPGREVVPLLPPEALAPGQVTTLFGKNDPHALEYWTLRMEQATKKGRWTFDFPKPPRFHEPATF